MLKLTSQRVLPIQKLRHGVSFRPLREIMHVLGSASDGSDMIHPRTSSSPFSICFLDTKMKKADRYAARNSSRGVIASRDRVATNPVYRWKIHDARRPIGASCPAAAPNAERARRPGARGTRIGAPPKCVPPGRRIPHCWNKIWNALGTIPTVPRTM